MFGKVFSKIAGFFFANIAKILSPQFKGLSKTIEFTDINEDINTYLSNSLFLAFLVGFILELLMVYVLLKLNIYFSIISFLVTIFIAATFAILIFIVLYKFPYYIVKSKKKDIETELEISVKHLSVLQDKNLTVKDVLLLLQSIEGNKILSEESKKILKLTDLNQNLKSTLKYICSNTYSEQEYTFFSKLIDVIDKRATLSEAISEYLVSVEQTKKEKAEQKKTKINLLFQINVFLFVVIFLLVFSIFLMPVYEESIKDLLFAIAIVFPIVEILLVFVLSK
ncbi:MAG: type II secretion system F family protein [Candidatus ainarchaeum sp.]|nr:type II secretion system F family protein [Candidatus ainarchaeum sp.]